MGLTAVPLGLVPLAFASAIVRYRLMDVEVILKRLLVYTAAVAAIVAIYSAIVRTTGVYFVSTEDDHRWVIAALATVVVLLLARPVKDAVQTAIDRVFYRDRYDYRRALVGFARELNTDLDLDRIAERLLTRVKDTLLVERLSLMSATGHGAFESLRHIGFDDAPPAIARGSAMAGRVNEGHVARLDDPIAAGRLPAEEVEYWRDAGLYYFVPCVSKGAAIAVLALGRRDNAEPLTSEDIVLLTAMAGQVATAIENARLYRELHVKAAEFDRLRVFNEHILESLDDGLLVVGGDGTVMRWNHALERIYGLRRGEAVGRSLETLFDAAVVAAVHSAKSASPNGGAEYRVPMSPRGGQAHDPRLVNITTVPLLPMPGREWAGTIVMFEDVTARARLEEQLRVSERMASLGLLAAGVAHEVNTPLTGISSYTQMLLEQADPADPRTQVLEKIEKQTFRAARIVNSLLNLSRPAPAQDDERMVVDLNDVANDVLALLEHQFEKDEDRYAGSCRRLRSGSRASSSSYSNCFSTCSSTPVTRCPAAGGSPSRRGSTGTGRSPKCATRGSACPPNTWRVSTIRFSPPRPWGTGPAWACPFPTGSSRNTTAPFSARALRGKAPRSYSTFPTASSGARRAPSSPHAAPNSAEGSRS